MKRRIFIHHLSRGGVLSAVGPSLFSACQRQQKPLNVVLMMADDLGYECLGCNGSDSYQTPHLDRMAGQGVWFSHCYSTPLCTPSRVQLMIGKYNFRNYTQFGNLPQDETCSDLIDFTDFLPTLLDATGLSLPQSDPVDGYSFCLQCQGKAGNPRLWVYGYYDPKWGRFSKSEYAHTRK